MDNIELIARIDSKVRPLLTYMPPAFVTGVYSSGRKYFLKSLVKAKPFIEYTDSIFNNKVLWNLNFGNSLFNAAGMYKYGEGYDLAFAQGAGAYLCGTTTFRKRTGNRKHNIKTPFAPFPRSNSAINWMGLPNPGHETVAKKISTIGHRKNCPLGASLAADTGVKESDALSGLIKGLELYDKAGICFMEINESCPNTEHNDSCEFDSSGLEISMINRLQYISENYLNKRKRHLPVVVKFSNDTSISQIPALLDLLLSLGFDGINLGNTSINYNKHKIFIHKSEQKLFEYFINNFGGGLSGNLLKENSLLLAQEAVKYINSQNPSNEFHVIRTGGIETAEDLLKSDEAGIALNQWFSGYFEAFSVYGHNLYKEIFTKLNQDI